MAHLDNLVRDRPTFHSMPSRTVTLTETKVMADGRESGSLVTNTISTEPATVNEARRLRVAEILRDYHYVQRRVSQFQANPPQDEFNEIGYSLLRQCHTEARTLLNVPYPPEMLHPPSAPNEAEKRQLQRYVFTKLPSRFSVLINNEE